MQAVRLASEVLGTGDGGQGGGEDGGCSVHIAGMTT